MFQNSKTFLKLFIMFWRSDGSRLKFTLVEASSSDILRTFSGSGWLDHVITAAIVVICCQGKQRAPATCHLL